MPHQELRRSRVRAVAAPACRARHLCGVQAPHQVQSAHMAGAPSTQTRHGACCAWSGGLQATDSSGSNSGLYRAARVPTLVHTRAELWGERTNGRGTAHVARRSRGALRTPLLLRPKPGRSVRGSRWLQR
eukprot:355359-Chlamydomonas_euryale.AAC.9